MGRVVVETYEGVETYVFDTYKQAKNFYEDTCESDDVRLVELYNEEDSFICCYNVKCCNIKCL